MISPIGSFTMMERQLCAVSVGAEGHGGQCGLQGISFLVHFPSKEAFKGRGEELRSKRLI